MLKVGEKASLFSLANQDDIFISIKDFTGKWIILYFYPKDNTSGCTIQACDFTEMIEEFDKMDCVILGVSPDSPASHQSFIEKKSLGITLLCDPNKDVLKKYNAWGKKKMYGKEYDGVKRSTVIIDPSGNIAKIYKNVKAKEHAKTLIADLEELQK